MASSSPPVRWLVGVLLLGWLAGAQLGCEAVGSRLGPDDSDVDAGSGPCRTGERHCEGNNLLVCDGGRFHQQLSCPVNQRCDGTLGCIDCLPQNPKLCVGDTVYSCNANGTLGSVVEMCQPGGCQSGTCGASSCAGGTDLIYAVDTSYRLFSFNPRDGKNEFTQIGQISCPAGRALDGGSATPFSMSVDRMGRAYVLYNSGEIFFVSTKDASCTKSGYKPSQSGFEVFGMGFVSDVAGASSETLFVAGGSYGSLTSADLGSIDSATLKLKKIGGLDLRGQHSPELTGTGKGELYGYYPGSSSFVAQIEKSSGKILNRWSLPNMSGDPVAWAFAHWGGRFYIFISLDDGFGSVTSAVYMLDPAISKTVKIKTNASYQIVGAGVSTCAPIVIG